MACPEHTACGIFMQRHGTQTRRLPMLAVKSPLLQLIARKIALKALELGCDAIMEGSSGKGNDQYRMHNVFKLFAPQLNVLVPVRDFDLTRGEEEEISKQLGIPITEVMQGGDDKTMWCRSLASGAIGLNQA